MSDEARTILIVTDDLAFSGQVSELMLRAGARKVQFAGSRDALDMTRAVAPDLVLLHVPHERGETSWDCYATLRADTTTSSIPVVLYAPPREQERAVGAAAPEPPGQPDRFLAQMSMLMGGSARQQRRLDDGVAERFPTGRDDL